LVTAVRGYGNVGGRHEGEIRIMELVWIQAEICSS